MSVMKPVNWELTKPQFPLYATPKIDGIRGFSVEYPKQQLLSCSNKPLPNKFIQRRVLPFSWDFEICCDDFRETTSFVMSQSAPVPPSCKIYLFDVMTQKLSHLQRLKQISKEVRSSTAERDGFITKERTSFITSDGTVYALARMNRRESYAIPIIFLKPTIINNEEQAFKFLQRQIDLGREGAMFRTDTQYKFGRSTPLTNELIRLKPFTDGEAVVVGINELFRNNNPKFTNELGHSDRSTSSEGLVPGGTFGSFTVTPICDRCCSTGEFNGEKCQACGGRFSIGTGRGLTNEYRQYLWDNRTEVLGRIVKFRYLACGGYDVARTASFVGFRDPMDLTRY